MHPGPGYISNRHTAFTVHVHEITWHFDTPPSIIPRHILRFNSGRGGPRQTSRICLGIISRGVSKKISLELLILRIWTLVSFVILCYSTVILRLTRYDYMARAEDRSRPEENYCEVLIFHECLIRLLGTRVNIDDTVQRSGSSGNPPTIS